MTLSASEIGQVIAELAPRWRGGQVQKVHMLGPRVLYLTLRIPGESGVLTFSAEPGRAALCLGERRGETDPEASAFCMLLRRKLKGARLEELAQVGGDRIVEVRTGRALLYVEMLGRRSALVLCEPRSEAAAGAASESKVLALSPAAGARPGLARGAPYQPPPAGGRPPRPSRLEPGRANEGACALLERARGAEARDEGRDRVARRLESLIDRERRRLSHIEADLERASKAGEHQRRGELLQIHLGQVRPGQGSVTVPDLLSGSDEPEPVEIALDPSLSPGGNLERIFTRARKARRAGEVATRRREESRTELDRLEALRARLEEVEGEAIGEIARAAGLGPEPTGGGKARTGAPARLPYRAYRDCRGGRILVGRSAGDNDRLTTEVARPHDLWLHARGYAGSHVVAPLEKGAEVDAERLLDAATLAAHFSEASGEATVEVTHTLRRYVQKPRKAPPGQVVLLREKVLLLRFEEDRLRRLLSSRVDS